jgi:diguanylate cyclase (GGDEF)-like protein/PAS domain S-box-containing protein
MRRKDQELLGQFKRALEVMQVGVTIADRDRKIIYANPAELELHGYSADELIGQDVGVLAPHGLLRPLSLDNLKSLRSWRRESLNVRKDGEVFPVEILSDVVLNCDGEPSGIVSICQDITERKKSEAALRESEQRYALAARGANDGLWDWNLEDNVTFFSPRWKALIGCSESEIGTNMGDWFNLVHLEDLPSLREDLDRHLTGKTEHFENEHRLLHKNGSYKWVLARGIAIRDGQGNATRMAGSLTDLTERKIRDPLTGLPNRIIFSDRVRHAFARAKRRPENLFAVLFLDLDGFKFVNDSLGHLAGDQLLVEVAGRLSRCIRREDTAARLGGDEFAILLEDLSGLDEGIAVVERIQEELPKSIKIAGQEIFTSASIGIAFHSKHYLEAEELIRDADTAMYAAKSKGRAGYRLFDQELRQHVVNRLKLETDLNLACERGEFHLEYQPVVSVESSQIVGVEALLRWDHPERGALSADAFLPVLEDTALIHSLNRWIVFEACRQLREWQTDDVVDESLTVSVNISHKHIGQSSLVPEVQKVLEDADLAGNCLELEFTELSLIDGSESLGDTLHELRKMGVRLCIDDFGTGYSSLNYISSLPISVLKIDRLFLQQQADNPGRADIVKTIVQLAKDLGIRAIAEGVETQEQLTWLKSLACPYAQGYYFSKPMGPLQARSYLLTRRGMMSVKKR